MSVDNNRHAEFEAALGKQRVLLTGHTGFTGGWLALWLRAIGCEVTGLALPPDTEPNLFSCARIGDQLNSRFGDIRDFATVKQAMEAGAARRRFPPRRAAAGVARVRRPARNIRHQRDRHRARARGGTTSAGRQGGGVRHHRQGLCGSPPAGWASRRRSARGARSLRGLQGGGRAGRCVLSRHHGGARKQCPDCDGARRQHHRRRRLVARPDRAGFHAGGGRGRAADAAEPGCGAALAARPCLGARLSRAGEPADRRR